MLAVTVPGDPGGTLIFTRMLSQGNSCEFGHYDYAHSFVRSPRIHSRAVHAIMMMYSFYTKGRGIVMVSAKNVQMLQKRCLDRQKPHYGLRKLSLGVASVLLSTTLYLGTSNVAHADTNINHGTDHAATNELTNLNHDLGYNANQVQVAQNSSNNAISNSASATASNASNEVRHVAVSTKSIQPANDQQQIDHLNQVENISSSLSTNSTNNQVSENSSVSPWLNLAVEQPSTASAATNNQSESWHTTINYQWSTTDSTLNPSHHGLDRSYAGKSPFNQNTVVTLTPKGNTVVPSYRGTPVTFGQVKDLGIVQGDGSNIGGLVLDKNKRYHKYSLLITYPVVRNADGSINKQVDADQSGLEETMYADVSGGTEHWMSADNTSTVKYYAVYNTIKVNYVDPSGKVIGSYMGQKLYPDGQKTGIFWEDHLPSGYTATAQGAKTADNLTWNGTNISSDGENWIVDHKTATVTVKVPVAQGYHVQMQFYDPNNGNKVIETKALTQTVQKNNTMTDVADHMYSYPHGYYYCPGSGEKIVYGIKWQSDGQLIFYNEDGYAGNYSDTTKGLASSDYYVVDNKTGVIILKVPAVNQWKIIPNLANPGDGDIDKVVDITGPAKILHVNGIYDITNLLPKGYVWGFAPKAKSVQLKVLPPDFYTLPKIDLIVDGQVVGKSIDPDPSSSNTKGIILDLGILPSHIGHLAVSLTADSNSANTQVVFTDLIKENHNGQLVSLQQAVNQISSELRDDINRRNYDADVYNKLISSIKPSDFQDSSRFTAEDIFDSYLDKHPGTVALYTYQGKLENVDFGADIINVLLDDFALLKVEESSGYHIDFDFSNKPATYTYHPLLTYDDTMKKYSSYPGIYVKSTDLTPNRMKEIFNNSSNEFGLPALLSDDQSYHIVWTATPQQSVMYEFVDDDNNQQLIGVPTIVSGSTGTRTSVKLPVPTGYELTSGQILPTAITFTNGNQVVRIHVQHRKPTVTYQFVDDDNGDSIIGTEVVYTGLPGTSKNVALTLPKYYKLADGQSLPTSVTFGDQDQTVLIHLKHALSSVTVHFLDANGNVVVSTLLSGNAGSKVSLTDVIPDGWVAYGDQNIPNQVIIGDEPSTIDYVITHRMFLVHAKDGYQAGDLIPGTKGKRFTTDINPNKLIKYVTRTVNVWTDSTKTTKLTTKIQEHDFTRDAIVDTITGNVTYLNWSGNGDYVFSGFTIPGTVDYKGLTIISRTVSVHDQNWQPNIVEDVVVDPHPNAGTLVFQTLGGQVVHTAMITGVDPVDISNYVPEGYHLLSAKMLHPFLSGKTSTYFVMVAPNAQTYTAHDQLPASVTEPLAKAVVRTIKITMPNGHVRTIKQQINFTRTATVDSQGQVTYSAWLATGRTQFNRFFIPKRRGYHVVIKDHATGKVFDQISKVAKVDPTMADCQVDVEYVKA